MRMRFIVPTGVPCGLRIRAPNRRKWGVDNIAHRDVTDDDIFRLPPSTVSRASPDNAEMQLVMAMF